MEVGECLFKFSFLWKFVSCVAILVLLLHPTALYQEDFSTIGFKHNSSFTSVIFKPWNHFCSPPSEVSSLNGSEILKVLDLPNGTVVSESLSRYGQCRRKSLELQSDASWCLCNPNPAYVCLICVSSISIVVYLCQIIFYKSFNDYDLILGFFGALLWFVAVATAILFQSLERNDELWLPDSLHESYYFRKPAVWTLAMVFAGICLFLSIMEFCLLDPNKDEMGTEMITSPEGGCKHALHRVIVLVHLRMIRINVCGRNNSDDWSMETPPRRNEYRRIEAMERYRFRPKPKFLHTFP